MIPNDFLPRDVYEIEGGAKRRRSSVSLREIVGVTPASEVQQPLAGALRLPDSATVHQTKEAWKKVAAAVYDTRSNNYKSNIIHTRRIFDENEELTKPLLVHSERCERASCSNTRRGNHTSYSNCTLLR